MKPRFGVILAAACAALIAWQAVPAAAAAGDLDPSFNGGAPKDFKVAGAKCGVSCEVADVAPSGRRIVVGGTVGDYPHRKFALTRLLSNGSPDPTFGGGDGEVVTPGDDARLGDIAVLSSGKILAVGQVLTGPGLRFRFLIRRYQVNGTVDHSFGHNGKTTLAFQPPLTLGSLLAPLPGGKFLLAGTIAKHEGDGTVILARFLADGHLDHSFGTDGRVKLRYPGINATEASALGVTSHGRIVVGGRLGLDGPGDYSDSFVARFLSTGRRDRSFSGDGLVRKDLGNNESIQSLVLEGTKIVVAGGTNDATQDMLLARFLGDGRLDKTFGGGDGIATPDFGQYDFLWAIARAPDGKLVGAGHAGDTVDPAVARFRPLGGKDTSFGTGGVKVVDNPSGGGEYRGVYALKDKRIVAAGRIDVANNLYKWEVVRLLGA